MLRFRGTAPIGQNAFRSHRKARLAFGLAIAGSIILTAPVRAQTEQYYTAGVSGLRVGLGTDQFGVSDTKSVPVSQSLMGTDWAATASSNTLNGGTVTASTLIASPSTSIPTYIDTLQAHAQLVYYFTLEGPTTTAKVPIRLQGSGTIFSDINYGFASATLQFGSSAAPTATYTIDSVTQHTTANDPVRTFSVDDIFYVTPGDRLGLVLDAFARVRYPGIANGKISQSTASVDPTFTILGGAANLYHFVGLPASAIGQGSAVPEPATWSMLIGGFGMVGAVMRRRQRRQTAAPILC